MARKKADLSIVAFKVEEELAKLLNQLPNKSDFIRKAITAQLGLTCPLCSGKGAVSGWLHEKYAPLVRNLRQQPCAECGEVQRIPLDKDGLGADALVRLQQFFEGGPLYCENCFRDTEACSDCGMHLEPKALRQHRKKAHDPKGHRKPPPKEP